MYKVLYDTEGDVIGCRICERKCLIKEGAIGICGNYRNERGKLWPTAYGVISSIQPRPIEIKPLFHYWPGSWALTFSGYGCNLHCPWCQNYELSFSRPKGGLRMSAEELVGKAVKLKQKGLSASFNEPLVHYSYLIDVFGLARERGLYCMMVTNGLFTDEALDNLMKAGADGFSLDVKACPGLKSRLLKYYDPVSVLKKAQRILNNGGHVELIYLIVTGFNDELACIEWFLSEAMNRLGYEVPIHFNRYYPAYRYHEHATSLNLMYMARDMARKKGLAFVYLGNIGDTEAETTFCRRCGKPLLVRGGGNLLRSYLIGDGCPRCGERLPIRGEVSKAYL